LIENIEMKQKQNAKNLPIVMFARHMQSGVARYDEQMILVDTETIKSMCPSFAGKPVFVGHDSKVAAFMSGETDEMPDQVDGYVADCFYNELDGWLWSKIIVTSDAGIEAVKKGWRVSNAYLPTEVGQGGTHHNVDYHQKIVNAEFTHLAIVPDPRYEDAVLMTPEAFKNYQTDQKERLNELQNSKQTGARKMAFKLFKNKKEEVETVDNDTMVELSNGKSVSLKEIINAVEKAETKNSEAEKEKVNMNAKVQVGNSSMTISELVNKYSDLMEKENESEAEKEKENESEADDEKENMSEDDDEKENMSEDDETENDDDDDEKKPSEKQNAQQRKKNFEELRNANNSVHDVQIIETSQDRMERGKARYGSGK